MIIAVGDSFYPIMIVKIPANGFLDTGCKIGFGQPPQIRVNLGGVDAIALVMAEAVFYVGDEAFVDPTDIDFAGSVFILNFQ